MLSHNLFRSITIDVLGSPVPTGDGSVQVFAEDRVLGRIDNRGQPRPVFAKLLGRSPMQFFVHPAKFFCDSLAVADVADRAQHEPSLLGGDRTETDFYREFRAIAPPAVEIQVRSHASGLRRLREVLAMMVVLGAIALRNQHFDLLADQFVAVVAK